MRSVYCSYLRIHAVRSACVSRPTAVCRHAGSNGHAVHGCVLVECDFAAWFNSHLFLSESHIHIHMLVHTHSLTHTHTYTHTITITLLTCPYANTHSSPASRHIHKYHVYTYDHNTSLPCRLILNGPCIGRAPTPTVTHPRCEYIFSTWFRTVFRCLQAVYLRAVTTTNLPSDANSQPDAQRASAACVFSAFATICG